MRQYLTERFVLQAIDHRTKGDGVIVVTLLAVSYHIGHALIQVRIQDDHRQRMDGVDAFHLLHIVHHAIGIDGDARRLVVRHRTESR